MNQAAQISFNWRDFELSRDLDADDVRNTWMDFSGISLMNGS